MKGSIPLSDNAASLEFSNQAEVQAKVDSEITKEAVDTSSKASDEQIPDNKMSEDVPNTSTISFSEYEDGFLPSELRRELEIVALSVDSYHNINSRYKFEYGYYDKNKVVESDLKAMKSTHTADILRSLSNVTSQIFKAWYVQYNQFVKTMCSVDNIYPIAETYISDINSRVMGKSLNMPVFQLSPSEHLLGMVSYGVGTGSDAALPYLHSQNNHMTITHNYSMVVGAKDSNHTILDFRSDDAENSFSYDHELTSFNKAMLNVGYDVSPSRNPYYVSS